MTRRTPEQWQQLFATWKASGLSQVQFCKDHKLCPKYFSLRRRQLSDRPTPARVSTGLVKVQPPAASSTPAVSIQHQGMEIRFYQADADMITTVVKQLT